MTMRNEAKLETLQELYDLGEVTASDYAKTNGLSLHCASMRLGRCYKQGLLGRWRDGREYVYYITDRGLERIEWLLRLKHWEIGITLKRCPVNRNQSVTEALDEESLENDFYEIDDDWDKGDEAYESEEDMDEDTESYQSEKDENGDNLDAFFKNIERCRVIRVEEDDSEVDENVE